MPFSAPVWVPVLAAWVGTLLASAQESAAPPPADPPPVASAPTRPAREFRVNDKVLAQEKSGRWSPATVKRIGRHHYYVSYDGWPDSWDEWVADARVRRRDTDTPQPQAWKPPPGHRAKPIPPEPMPTATSPAAEASAAVEDTPLPAGDPLVLTIETPATSNYVPDAAPAAAPRPPLNLALRGGSRGPFDAASALLTSGQWAAVVWTDGAPGDNPYAPVVERVDLAAGQALGLVTMPPGTKVLAIAPDGKRVAGTRDGWGMHTPTELRVVELTGQRRLMRFRAFQSAQSDVWDGIDEVRFAGSDLVIARSRGGSIAAFDVSGELPRALWKTDHPAGAAAFDVSAGGRYVAVMVGPALLVVEAATGAVVARDPGVGAWLTAAAGALRFSPAGERLAVVAGGWVHVSRLAGEAGTAISIYAPAAGADGTFPVGFVGEGQFLSPGGVLIDLDAGVPLWSYVLTGGVRNSILTAARGLLWTRHQDGPRESTTRLHSLALPDAGAAGASKSLASRQDLWSVQPGMAVAIDIELGPWSEHADTVREGLIRAARDAGLVPRTPEAAPNRAELRLVATLEPGDSRQVPYQLIGRGTETIGVQERRWRVRLERDGQMLWEQAGIDGAPAMITVREGQSVEQAVATARTAPPQLFSRVRVPGKLVGPTYARGLGTTDLTAPTPPRRTP